jgi:Kef-type K+ transport system membrane component KefB
MTMSLLFQIPVVILVTLAFGSLARRLGQSRVIGEIAVGLWPYRSRGSSGILSPVFNGVV